jgi:SpoVK/Ycf46/Vps4 family AAA+-type ATPase
VFVVATANDISQLPAELMRKGRLDEIFFVDLPDDTEREEIFRIHLALRKRDPENFDLKTLTASSREFSGAEIKEAVISALYEAFYEGRELTTGHIVNALQETVPLSKTMDEQINSLRAWAEGRARNASRQRFAQNEMGLRQGGSR